MCLGKGSQAHLRCSEYRVTGLVRERARVDGGVRKATARARPRACASAVRGQRARRGERWRSLARATRARAARRSGERPGARRVLAASGRLTSFLRRDSPKIYRCIEHTVLVCSVDRAGRRRRSAAASAARRCSTLLPGEQPAGGVRGVCEAALALYCQPRRTARGTRGAARGPDGARERAR